jgi:hypothetical protein
MPNHNHNHHISTTPTHGFNRGRHHHRPNPRLQSWESSSWENQSRESPSWDNQSQRSLRLLSWGNLLSLALLLSPFLLFAQPNTPTKIADILATLPATSNQAAERNYAELLATGAVGLGLVCEQVAPSGQAAGVAPRYAVSLLTHYAKTAVDKALIEKAYLQALGKASDTEVKAYFISNIQLVGTTASVKPLSAYFSNDALYAPAIAALVTIRTPDVAPALVAALKTAKPAVQNRIIEALGELKAKTAIPSILAFASSTDLALQKQALWSLALMGEGSTYSLLLNKAKAVDFKNDPTEAASALVEYLKQLQRPQNIALVSKLASDILAVTLKTEQQHYRLAALKALNWANAELAVKTLNAELNRFDAEYRREVLKVAASSLKKPTVKPLWEAIYSKATADTQGEILAMLAAVSKSDPVFLEKRLLPGLSSNNAAVRTVSANAIALTGNKKYATNLLDYLLKATSNEEAKPAQQALLQVVDKDNCKILVEKLGAASPAAQLALIQILGERRASAYFDNIAALTQSADTTVQNAAYQALSRLSTSAKLSNLLGMLPKTDKEAHLKAIQAAIVPVLDASSVAVVNEAYQSNKNKVIPILAYLEDKGALEKVKTSFEKGTGKEKEAAFAALCNWNNSEAIQTLLKIRQNPDMSAYHSRAFNGMINQLNRSTWNDEQKLAILSESVLGVNSKADQIAVVRAIGRLRGLAALMSANRFIDNPDLSATASRSVMQIALPTADAKPGLTGSAVRSALERARKVLDGPDSQYELIDIDTYMAMLPPSGTETNQAYELTADEKKEGFDILFNGKNLDNWVGNKTDYVVDNYTLAIYPTATQNRGNLYTAKEYGDFIFRFEFQLTPGANNGLGIHAPLEGDAAYVGKEIQILDNTAPIYAKLEQYQYHGSVYGVMPAKRDFLKPVGEWNQEEVYVKGNFIRVTLNGTVIVEGDMKEASKSGTLDHKDHPGLNRNTGHIGFLGHGSILKFRNIRIKDLTK